MRTTVSLALVALVTTLGAVPSARGQTKKSICSWHTCTVHKLDAAAKKEIEAQEDRDEITVEFDETAADADVKTIAQVPWVKSVSVRSNKTFSDLSAFSSLKSVTKLDFYGSDKVVSLAPIKGLTTLVELDLYMTKVADLKPIASMTALKKLELYATEVTDLSPIAKLTGLTYLGLYMVKVADWAPVKGLVNLEELWISFADLKDLSVVAGMKKLKKIDGGWMSSLTDISALLGLSELETLELREAPITTIAPLSGATHLKTLELSTTKITSLAPLSKTTELESLDVSSIAISDLTPLAGATELTSLDLRNTKVTSLAPLAKLTKLAYVDLEGTAVKDLSPLTASAKSLYRVTLPKGTPATAWAGLAKLNPKAKFEVAK
jgi:Leucine-rich repeat (LRR) protein